MNYKQLSFSHISNHFSSLANSELISYTNQNKDSDLKTISANLWFEKKTTVHLKKYFTAGKMALA